DDCSRRQLRYAGFDHAWCHALATQRARGRRSAGSGSRAAADRTQADTADCSFCRIVRRLCRAVTRERLHLLPALCFEAEAEILVLPSRPGELHPEPLTEPDLTLSHHPARATAQGCRLPLVIGFLPLPVDPRQWR